VKRSPCKRVHHSPSSRRERVAGKRGRRTSAFPEYPIVYMSRRRRMDFCAWYPEKPGIDGPRESRAPFSERARGKVMKTAVIDPWRAATCRTSAGRRDCP